MSNDTVTTWGELEAEVEAMADSILASERKVPEWRGLWHAQTQASQAHLNQYWASQVGNYVNVEYNTAQVTTARTAADMLQYGSMLANSRRPR